MSECIDPLQEDLRAQADQPRKRRMHFGPVIRLAGFVGVILTAMLLLFGAWVFLLPIPIPVPSWHSPLLDALEQSNARIRATERYSVVANPEDIAGLLPKGLAVKKAESLLVKERLHCSPYLDVGARQAEYSGERLRHYKVCRRCTYVLPLGIGGWEIDLFADRNDAVESVYATRYYDGV
jgi:hypothetical protein